LRVLKRLLQGLEVLLHRLVVFELLHELLELLPHLLKIFR